MIHALRSLPVLFVLLACSLTSLAQTDPPARVGRLSLVENTVEFRVDRNAPGGPATLNWPVSSGAQLRSERNGRAEVWIGSSAFRLGSNSEIEFAAVDDRQIAIRQSGGTLVVSILDHDQTDDIRIATPDTDIRFATPGRYRIDIRNDHSVLSVQAGQAYLDDNGRQTPVNAGEQALVWADRQIRIERDTDQDNFDRWVAERENASLANNSRRHVSPYMTGYHDLDTYGDWQSAPDYGTVWYPRGVSDDWAPYRYGRWAWIAPWGWTWIDQAPWGFAPFHYGRWVIIHGRWGWIPGSHVARPVYAPALVAWHGDPGWSLSFSFGSAPAVGWFPLGPREVYVPAYRYSPTYIRQINITHIHDTHVIDRASRPGGHQNFAYRDLPRAVTVVPAEHVREGRPINRQAVRIQDRRELERAPQVRSAPQNNWLTPSPRMQHQPDARSEQPRTLPEQRRDEPLRNERNMRENQNDAWRSRPEMQRREVPIQREPMQTLPGNTDATPRNEAPAPKAVLPQREWPQRENPREAPPQPAIQPRIQPEIMREAPVRQIEAPQRQPESRPEMPQRDMRREDNRVFQRPEPEMRRETREAAPRFEAPAPRVQEAPVMHQPREMPRMESRPQEGRGNENRRDKRDDDRRQR